MSTNIMTQWQKSNCNMKHLILNFRAHNHIYFAIRNIEYKRSSSLSSEVAP